MVFLVMTFNRKRTAILASQRQLWQTQALEALPSMILLIRFSAVDIGDPIIPSTCTSTEYPLHRFIT